MKICKSCCSTKSRFLFFFWSYATYKILRNLYKVSRMPSCFIGLCLSTFKRQSHKVVKHSQAIRRQFATNCLSAFDHFVKLALKGLSTLMFWQTLVIQISWQSWNILMSSRSLLTVQKGKHVLIYWNCSVWKLDFQFILSLPRLNDRKKFSS